MSMTLDDEHENENYFRQIADNIDEFIWLSDVGFTTHYYVNRAYEKIWGRTAASLYADPQSLLDGIHSEDRDRVRQALLGMPDGDYDIEFRVVRPDGGVRWVWSRGVPVRNERGEIVRIAGITEDITERKRAEMEIERIAESRTGLIRGFTHDIKNPLGAADGFLSLLGEGIYGELSGDQAATIERARKAIGSALDLIAHLLDLARAESGELEIQPVPVDVRAKVFAMAEAFRPQADINGLSLDVDVPPWMPSIQSDPARVQQILGNLISNAIKYTQRGGHVTIHASAEKSASGSNAGDGVVIEVIDDGPGISPENQKKLFREFTRFDPEAAEGAGIGLAISQRIARALGGTITVESEPDSGSRFSLSLPLRLHNSPRVVV
ncbi:MAG TPA: PAS domain-containing sensor histidine kinase [Gemmatimonadaceae bacterium]|nr:PAS domain-containing sensor histidine kinase [Gemmatimonadaceae bacterium]